LPYVVDLRHRLTESGNSLFLADKNLAVLGQDVKRVSRMVEGSGADAWIVLGGSGEVLDWFSQRAEPTIALFGMFMGRSIAGVGPNSLSAFAVVGRRLVELGHRRIVILVRKQHRQPQPGRAVRAFLDELESGGIQTGSFNLPDWEESKEGFRAILESLFGPTSPTALFIDEAYLFVAAQQFLGERGLRVPGDVSLVCTDPDPTFAWCEPSVTHLHWDPSPLVRRIVRWADKVSRGKQDLRQTYIKTDLVDGGTLGPAKNGE
jgi:DNA-binding LacI/PurR family transcriptional regulator